MKTHLDRPRAIAPMLLSAVAAAILTSAPAACSPASDAHAQNPRSTISIVDPWAAATPPAARVAAGYVTLRNGGASPDRLVSAESPRAARVELHEMSMSGGVMRMRQVRSITVPARGVAALAPGGLHIMFIDIDAPFAEGQRIPVTLRFESLGELHTSFVVRPRRATGGSNAGH